MTPQHITQTLASRNSRHIDPPRDPRRSHTGPDGAPVYLSADERDHARAEAVIELLWLQDIPPGELTTGQLKSLMSRAPHIWTEAARAAGLITAPLDERGNPLMICEIRVSEWHARHPEWRPKRGELFPKSTATPSHARFSQHLKSLTLR
jgi:hypothetical protein